MKKLGLTLTFIMLLSVITHAKSISVSGSVKDSKGAPIAGASIIIVGTQKGTTSDNKGVYQIAVEEKQTLQCQSLGYQTVHAIVNGTIINFILNEDATQLDQVVVIGYGSVKKSDLTGSVASIKPELINKQPASSFEKLLQGRSAGLQIITNDDPGAGSTVRIRGGSSLYSSNTPLLVIDGFPAGDAGGLKQISPNDIESIDILKDASASAIYGSRGANGVIIITTKRAKQGTTRVEIQNQLTIGCFASEFDQYKDPLLMAQLSNESFLNAGLTPLYIGREDASGVYYPSLNDIATGAWPYFTDWADLVFKNTPITNNTSISVSSANEKTAFNLSLGYLSQQGISIKDKYSKGNVNLSLSHSISKDLKIRFNNILSRDHRNDNKMFLRNPIFPAYNNKGDYYLLNDLDYYHPLALANHQKNTSNGFDNIAMLGLDYQILSYLKFTGQVNYKYGTSVGDVYLPPKYTFEGDNRNGYGKVSNSMNQDVVAEAFLTFDKNWNDVHALNIMGGYSFNYSMNRSSLLTGEDFINTSLENEALQFGKPEKQHVENYLSRSEMVSGMLRINYSLLNKYLFTFTSRMDGSSKFGDNNKWALFPSGAVSWKIHEENFVKSLKVVDELKIRASYGISGNQGISPYQTLPVYGQKLYYYNNSWANAIGQGTIIGYEGVDGRMLVYGGIGNPDLRWETTAQTNIGLDAALFNSRLRLTVDYYSKKTNNLIRDAFLPPSSAFDKKKVNGGSILNRGIEVTIAGDIVRNEDWGISATAVFSRNRNELLSLGDVSQIGFNTDPNTGMNYQHWGSVPSIFRETSANILAIGHPVNVFYGYRVDGIIQSEYEGLEAGLTGDLAKPGEFRYVDIDESGTVDPNDRCIIGDPNPDFLASLALSFRYKNFDAEIFLNGAFGGDIVNSQAFGTARTQPLRWTQDNPSNKYPSLRQTRYDYKLSDWWIEDGSYLKIQNLNIGYNFNFKNKFISGIRLYFNATNLYTFTKFDGYDPEIGLDGLYNGGLPRQRQFTFGVNVKF